MCRLHRFPWASPASRPYHPSLSVSLPCYILYQYRDVVDRFEQDRPTLARQCEGFHRHSSLISSSLFTPAVSCMSYSSNLDVFWDSWSVSAQCCFVRCCLQVLFDTVRSILVQLPSSFLSIRLVSVHVEHPYSRIDTNAAWKKLRLILSDSSDFHLNVSLSMAVQDFASRLLIFSMEMPSL